MICVHDTGNLSKTSKHGETKGRLLAAFEEDKKKELRLQIITFFGCDSSSRKIVFFEQTMALYNSHDSCYPHDIQSCGDAGLCVVFIQ